MKKNLLRACVALFLVWAAAPAPAQVKSYFTTASAYFCKNSSCAPIILVTGTVPGAGQWSAACEAMWAQATVEAYIFPNGAFHHGEQAGCYWYYSTAPNSVYRNTSPINIEIPDPKNSGVCDDNCEGNPINPGTGNKFQIEIDYTAGAPSSLKFGRTYNSTRSLQTGRLGTHWRGTYDRSITVTKAGTAISTVIPTMFPPRTWSSGWLPSQTQAVKSPAFSSPRPKTTSRPTTRRVSCSPSSTAPALP